MSAAAPYRSLPPELLDELFEELKFRASVKDIRQDENIGVIRSCLFVSRSFRHRALLILFRNVNLVIRPYNAGNKHVLLLKNILSPPSTSALDGVGNYIENFSISLQPRKMTIFSSPSEHLAHLKRFLSDDNLHIVMRCLHGNGYGIKELKIGLSVERYGRGSCGLKWEEFDPHFRDALQDLIRSPSLNYLWISDVHHIPLTILDKSHVKYLLHHQSILGQRMSLFSHSAQDLPYPVLEAHFFSRLDPHIERKPSISPFQCLRGYVALSNAPEQLKVTWDVISLGARSLEAIAIQNYGILARPPPKFALDQVMNLSWFSYSQRHIPFFTPDNVEQNLGNLYRFLNIKSSMNHLKNMVIDLQCYVSAVPSDFLHQETEAMWGKFDDLFVGPKYPSLESVGLKVFVEVVLERDDELDSFSCDRFIAKMTVQIQQCFPKVSRKRGLSFQIGVDASLEVIE